MLWAILGSWISVGIVVPVLIGIGVGVMSMTPPDFVIAKASFCSAALVLTARVAWWLGMELPPQTSRVHPIVFAIFVFGGIGGLWMSALVWVDGRRSLNESTQKTSDSRPAAVLNGPSAPNGFATPLSGANARLVEPPHVVSVPTASEIASAVSEKTKLRDAFTKEMDKQIVGMYAIVSLNKSLVVDELSNIASVVQILDPLEDEGPSLFFGFRPDTREWTEIPSNRRILMNGVRSEVWSFPKTSNPDSKPSMIDSFLVYRFDFLDRLEAGAMMNTPFKTVGQLDHALVLLKATRALVDYIDRVTLVVNDYVVFEVTKTDIVDWSAPPPPMIGQIVRGRLDPSSGKLTDQEIVKATPFEPNFMLADGFKKIPFFTAMFSNVRAQAPPPMNNVTTIDMVEVEIRRHRTIGGAFTHRAGNGEMMILPEQHGWLPKEHQ